MSSIKIGNDKRSFIKNSKPFFYLADTCWSAFTNITLEEWEYYLDLRRKQGFNVLQINILPQWDASGTELNNYPLITADKKIFQFTELKGEYFENARKMCIMAKDKGFDIALVVLWCNYVPDTWASNMMNDNIMPFEFIDTYINKVHETFSDLDPIYIISGDTDFNTERTVAHYKKAGELLRELAPEALYTLHIKGRYTYIPEELLKLVDFYMYQSGHNAENMAMPYLLAEEFYNNYPAKPIINSEPCYEQMGYSRKMYGRFYQYDVRRAAWMSILSGASAGITYGAHGIYSWHKVGKRFGMGLGEGFDAPNSWNDAIKYPGAWDYGYIKYLLKTYNITKLDPCEDIILNDSKDIRIATNENKDKMLVYIPINTNIKLNLDLTEYDVFIIDLDSKNIGYPDVQIKEGQSVIKMHNFEQDALALIMQK